jgi:hypothetical protein
MVTKKPATCSLVAMALGLPCVNSYCRKLHLPMRGMWLDEALRDDDDGLAEKLRRFETSQLQM